MQRAGQPLRSLLCLWHESRRAVAEQRPRAAARRRLSIEAVDTRAQARALSPSGPDSLQQQLIHRLSSRGAARPGTGGYARSPSVDHPLRNLTPIHPGASSPSASGQRRQCSGCRFPPERLC